MPFGTAGNLLYIPNFEFKNGGSKNKYFLVVAASADSIVVVSLPTSQNYIPSHLEIVHGCMDSPPDYFNCYHFEQNRIICDSGFCFSLPTYLYGENVDTYTIAELRNIKNFNVIGQLIKEELAAIIDCFKSSVKVKNKIKRLL